jgi:hypothetical protein
MLVVSYIFLSGLWLVYVPLVVCKYT